MAGGMVYNGTLTDQDEESFVLESALEHLVPFGRVSVPIYIYSTQCANHKIKYSVKDFVILQTKLK